MSADALRGALRDEKGTVEDMAFDMAHDDVLTAWRVRNAALMVAASFVHPGPDGEDYKIRREMVREWVNDGHDQVDGENHQRTQMLGRMVRAEHEAARLREALTELVDLTDHEHADALSGRVLTGSIASAEQFISEWQPRWAAAWERARTALHARSSS